MRIAVEALIYIYKHMQKRPGYKTPPKPSSAVAVLRGVARAHKRMGYEFVDLSAVAAAANKLTMKYMELNGYESLLPRRAPPITNDEIERVLKEGEGAIPDGAALGPFTYRRGSKVGRSFRGVIATLAQCGFRGDEVSLVNGHNGKSFSGETCLSRASIRWKFGVADWTSSPTREQLEGLRDGDMVMIIPPPSKADKFGTAWGNNPIYLEYRSAAKINAARELAQIELAVMASGEAERRKLPLFTGPNGAMLQRGDLSAMLSHALLLVGVAPVRAADITIHSFRRYLACALLEKRNSPDRICAFLRWRSTKSLAIYAQMNPAAYAEAIAEAGSADISSVITLNSHFPRDVTNARRSR